MLNIIGIEGPNNIGKTTLINKITNVVTNIKRPYNFTIKHYTGFLNFEHEFNIIKKDIVFMNSLDIFEENNFYIYDRMSFTAAPFFGVLYRNYTQNQIDFILNYVKKELIIKPYIKVYICKNDNINIFEREDDYLKQEHRHLEIDYYYNKLPKILEDIDIKYEIIDINDKFIIDKILYIISK